MDPGKASKHLFEPPRGDANRSAMDANMQAIMANTAALRAMKEGIFGGGARTQGAIPAGVRGEMFRRAVEGGSLKMGAFVA
jgi:hypothetical protein